MNKFRAWTIRYEEKDGSDFHYAKVVAKSLASVMYWCTNKLGIDYEQVTSATSEEIAIADE